MSNALLSKCGMSSDWIALGFVNEKDPGAALVDYSGVQIVNMNNTDRCVPVVPQLLM